MTEQQTTFSLDQPAYRLHPDEIARLLVTNLESGLSKHEAARRHGILGDNTLRSDKGVSMWKVLIRQVANAMTLVETQTSKEAN